LTNKEIVAFWGEHMLARWPEALASRLRIPEASRSFLTQVGFPRQGDWTLTFPGPSQTIARPAAQSNLAILGYDDEMAICVDEGGGQANVGIVDTAFGSNRFVNSTIEALGAFLVLYESYRRRARNMGEAEAMRLVESTFEEMKAVDDCRRYLLTPLTSRPPW
jgi:hypothetical protein